MNIEAARKYFEELTIPNFVCGENVEIAKERYKNGPYKDPKIEDHWDTFQEGWEAALELFRKEN